MPGHSVAPEQTDESAGRQRHAIATRFNGYKGRAAPSDEE